MCDYPKDAGGLAGRVFLAFYRKEGNFGDKLIRWRTNSEFSHTELVVSGVCYSSSPRDGGVRSTRVSSLTNRDSWELVELDAALATQILLFFKQTSGRGYDYLGTVVGQVWGLYNVQERSKFFCSEWCAAALGLQRPYQYSPGALYKEITEGTAGTQLNRCIAIR
jgi:hypothetical protein